MAYKIMKMRESDKTVVYRASCDCGEPDHDLDLYWEFGA